MSEGGFKKMNIIKISTDLELTIHEFLIGSYQKQNQFLRELIGNHCELYEHVKPRRLYTEFQMKNHVTNIAGQCVSMLVDEEGGLKDNEVNLIGSYLYETDTHQQPIMGNILFVGERWIGGEVDFCGIDETVFKYLEQELNQMIYSMKRAKEAFGK